MVFRHAQKGIRDDKMKPIKTFVRVISFKRLKFIWLPSFLLSVLIFVSQVVLLMKSRRDLVKLMEILTTFIFTSQVLYKLIIVYCKEAFIDEMYKKIEDEFLDPVLIKSAQRNLIHGHLRNVNVTICGHLVICICCATAILTFPVSKDESRKRYFPVELWFPFETDSSPLHEVIFVVLTVNGVLSVYASFAFDYCFVYFGQHLLMQFKLLQEMLKNLTRGIDDGKSDVDKFRSNRFQRMLINRVCYCAKYHDALIRFGRNLEEYAAVSLVVHLLMIMTSAVDSEFLASRDPSDKMRCFKLLLIFLNVFGQMLFYAYHGSELQFVSKRISTDIFHCGWYLGNKSVRRALVFMQMNSQNELKITAFRFADVNNSTIIWIYRTAFSIFTLLRKIQESK